MPCGSPREGTTRWRQYDSLSIQIRPKTLNWQLRRLCLSTTMDIEGDIEADRHKETEKEGYRQKATETDRQRETQYVPNLEALLLSLPVRLNMNITFSVFICLF